MAATLWSCQWGMAGVTSEKGVPVIKRDLEEIRSEGKLRALVAYSATGYFLYKGQPMGYEYELLKRLAEHLNLELEVRVVQDLDQMLEILQKGIEQKIIKKVNKDILTAFIFYPIYRCIKS